MTAMMIEWLFTFSIAWSISVRYFNPMNNISTSIPVLMMTDLILHHLHFQVMSTMTTSLLFNLSAGNSSSASLELQSTTDSNTNNHTIMVWPTL